VGGDRFDEVVHGHEVLGDDLVEFLKGVCVCVCVGGWVCVCVCVLFWVRTWGWIEGVDPYVDACMTKTKQHTHTPTHTHT
jgi:hypothetical protein